MALEDHLNAVIETIYGAAADAEAWPDALRAATELLEGAGATLEVIDKATLEPVLFSGAGVPTASEIDYLSEFIATSPRVALGCRQKTGDIGYDGQILSDREMDRDPFYNDFLAPHGFRYFVSGCLLQTPERYGVVAVQRTAKQGHVTAQQIALMKRLVPHFRQALDLSLRFHRMRQARADAEHALDRLQDGVMVLDETGLALHLNARAEEMVQEGDGLELSGGLLRLTDHDAMKQLGKALEGCLSLRGHDGIAATDVTARRPSGGTPFILALRAYRDAGGRARAVLFIREPATVPGPSRSVLRKAFGLTDAEAGLALALIDGASLRDHAEAREVSINTVYTHYKRLKDKTGSRSQVDLMATLKDMTSPAVS